MLFWLLAGVLTIGASLAVLIPLTARRDPAPAGAENDLQVYKDQLAELESDAGRGLIRPTEKEEAKAEIARRMIRADTLASTAQGLTRSPSSAARMVAATAVLAVPLVSWGLYGVLGSPDLPSQPLAERLAKNPADSSVEELVARAEGHLAANPDDGRGWDVLAPIYIRLGRFEDAVNAYRNAIRLDGATATRESGLGEAIAAVAGGLVTADAHAAFERAEKLDPNEPRARFYLASALAQEGKLKEARTAWQSLLDTLPAQSPWRSATETAIAETTSRIAAAEAPAQPGPDQQQIEAAAGMPQADRDAMIETMVAGLDEKLRQNPRDEEGWTRLVRSYVVLGKDDQARDAAKRAIEAFGAGSEEGKRIAAFSSTLGITVTE